MKLTLTRINHWVFGHPNLEDIQEDHAVVEDLISHAAYVQMSGWCIGCKRRIYWQEEN